MTGPLQGRTVLVTRAPEQASDLIGLLQAAGAEAVSLPTVAFFPPVDARPLDRAIAEIGSYAWVAFTSSNAVHAFFERVKEPVAESLRGVRVAAVGPKTAEALARWGVDPGLVAAKGNAASLADGLSRICRPGDRVLYPRAERVSDDLAGRLMARGIQVEDPIAYRTVPPAGNAFEVAGRLKDGTIHWITAMSGSAIRHLHAMLPEPEWIRNARIATIGPKTSAEARALGYAVAAEAAEPSAAALVQAIVAAESQAGGPFPD